MAERGVGLPDVGTVVAISTPGATVLTSVVGILGLLLGDLEGLTFDF